MKKKLCISMDEETYKKLLKICDKEKRKQSAVIEIGINLQYKKLFPDSEE